MQRKRLNSSSQVIFQKSSKTLGPQDSPIIIPVTTSTGGFTMRRTEAPKRLRIQTIVFKGGGKSTPTPFTDPPAAGLYLRRT